MGTTQHHYYFPGFMQFMQHNAQCSAGIIYRSTLAYIARVCDLYGRMPVVQAVQLLTDRIRAIAVSCITLFAAPFAAAYDHDICIFPVKMLLRSALYIGAPLHGLIRTGLLRFYKMFFCEK